MTFGKLMVRIHNLLFNFDNREKKAKRQNRCLMTKSVRSKCNRIEIKLDNCESELFYREKEWEEMLHGGSKRAGNYLVR